MTCDSIQWYTANGAVYGFTWAEDVIHDEDLLNFWSNIREDCVREYNEYPVGIFVHPTDEYIGAFSPGC